MKSRTPRRGLGAPRGVGTSAGGGGPKERTIAFQKARAKRRRPDQKVTNFIRVGIKGGWTPPYQKGEGFKIKGKREVTELRNKYQQFEGIVCTNVGCRVDEKVYTFDGTQVDQEMLANTVTAMREVKKRHQATTRSKYK